MLRPNFIISRKTGNLVISVAFAAILLFYFAGIRRLSFFTGWAGEAKSGGSVQSAEAHTLAASYYSAKNGLKSTLMISNQGPNQMPTQVRLFNRDGKQFDLPAMNLGAHEFRAIDLGQYAASDASFEEGSVQVEYQGRKMEMGGAVTIADAARSLLSDEELVEPAREFASSQLEGLWWQPGGGAEVSLAVSNTSSARLSVTVSATAGGRGDAPTLNLVLNAHETRILGAGSSNDNERLVLRGNAGGISIQHSGAPGALIAYGFVQERSTGFSSVIDFSDPQRAKTARLDGAGLRIGNLQGKRLSQILVVRNISSEQVTISGRILCTLGNGTDEVVGLEEFQLGPGEVRRINLRPAITQQTRGRRVESAGLEIAYTGNPGAIIATAASVSPDEDQVFRVPMRDAAVQSSSTGIYPWSIDETSSSFVYIKNVTDSPKQFTMMISYEGGNYALGEVSVSGGKTVTYDIRKLRDSQKPDASGSVIPLQATGGKVHWSVRGPEIKSLIGRIEQADLVNGVSMTVACGLCCADSYYDSWITPGTVQGIIEDTTQFSLFRRDRDCFGFIKDPIQQFYSNWSCDNTSVATINSQTGLGTAVGAGSSWIRNPFSATVYTDEGSFCSESTSTADPTALCTVLAPSLQGPASVTRGQSATFTVVNARASQVTSWSFSDGANPAVSGPNATLTWTGTMVTGGTVSVVVTQRGTPTTLTKNISVNARNNFAVTAASPSKVPNGYVCGGLPINLPSPPVPGGELGRFCLIQPYGYGFALLNSGPNNGYRYITSVTNNATYNYVISPDAENTNSAFYQANCGSYNAQTNPNGFISGATLLSNIINHEAGTVQNSHYVFYKMAQDAATNNIGVNAEMLVGAPGIQESTFNNQVTTTLNSKTGTIGTATQIEPCGQSDVRYDANCTFRGHINNPPYQACP